MTETLTIECDIHFRRRGRGSRKLIHAGPESTRPTPPGRVPRVSRLMALAIRIESLIREGAIRNYSDAATLGHVTRARVSQIMNLLNLAPDIQEEVLFLPCTVRGRDGLHLHELQPIAAVIRWSQQRALWKELQNRKRLAQGRRF